MRILVGCEESQTITKAFRKRGFECYSCDLQECSGGHPEWHLQCDVLDILNDGWDLAIFHPTCTMLANSGVQHLYKNKEKNEDRWDEMYKAAEFFNRLKNANIPRICVENPIPHKYAREIIGKYTQIIQPWMFGHMEKKATCLWLKNLPKLVPTTNLKKETDALPKKEQQRLHYLGPSKDRAKLRSKTFKGIAEAIAEQWGNLLCKT